MSCEHPTPWTDCPECKKWEVFSSVCELCLACTLCGLLVLSGCVTTRRDDGELQKLNHTRMLYAKCRSDLYFCKNKRSIEVEETEYE